MKKGSDAKSKSLIEDKKTGESEREKERERFSKYKIIQPVFEAKLTSSGMGVIERHFP